MSEASLFVPEEPRKPDNKIYVKKMLCPSYMTLRITGKRPESLGWTHVAPYCVLRLWIRSAEGTSLGEWEHNNNNNNDQRVNCVDPD